MDKTDLDAFERTLVEINPGIKVRFKDESLFQKALGLLVRPFNPTFLTEYTTTIGSTVYFPSREFYYAKPESSFSILAHEYVHIWDFKRDRWFKFKYLFPQILGLVPLVVFGLFVWFSAWWWLSLLGLVAVAPWPAKKRTSYELRGYGMNVAIAQWVYGRVQPSSLTHIVDQFVGSSYYYMCRDRKYVEGELESFRQQAALGVLQNYAPYDVAYRFLSSRNNLLPKS
jgi:hypothetical protein